MLCMNTHAMDSTFTACTSPDDSYDVKNDNNIQINVIIFPEMELQ